MKLQIKSEKKKNKIGNEDFYFAPSWKTFPVVELWLILELLLRRQHNERAHSQIDSLFAGKISVHAH